MQMPIDFTVIANDLKKYDYHIPNNWFIKKQKPKFYQNGMVGIN